MTWLSSCAITPAISPSLRAASIMPRLTNIGPPGSAKALMSRALTTSNEYWNSGCWYSGGIAATSGRLTTELHVLLRSEIIPRRDNPRLRQTDHRRDQDDGRHHPRRHSVSVTIINRN